VVAAAGTVDVAAAGTDVGQLQLESIAAGCHIGWAREKGVIRWFGTGDSVLGKRFLIPSGAFPRPKKAFTTTFSGMGLMDGLYHCIVSMAEANKDSTHKINGHATQNINTQ